MASSAMMRPPARVTSHASAADQSQLDEILGELLGDQFLTDRSAQSDLSLAPAQGSITTHSGNSRTVVSWETSQAGQGRAATVTKHTVSTPSPNVKTETVKTVVKEEFAYTSPQQLQAALTDSQAPQTHRPSPRIPSNAFSYIESSKQLQQERASVSQSAFSSQQREEVTSPVPPPRESSRARMSSPSMRERIASPTFGQQAPPPRVHHFPYRTEHDERRYWSDSEQLSGSLSWLEKQQRKLEDRKRGGHASDVRRENERRLVNELKHSSVTQRRRTASETREPLVNGPLTSQTAAPTASAHRPRRTPEKTAPVHGPRAYSEPHDVTDSYRSEKRYYVTGVERPPFTTHQTKYTFSVSSSKDGNGRSKPPPSPAASLPPQRSAPASPIVPVRRERDEARPREQPERGRSLSSGRQRTDYLYQSSDYIDRFVDRYSDLSPRSHHASHSTLPSPDARHRSPHWRTKTAMTSPGSKHLSRSSTFASGRFRPLETTRNTMTSATLDDGANSRTLDGSYVRRVSQRDEGNQGYTRRHVRCVA